MKNSSRLEYLVIVFCCLVTNLAVPFVDIKYDDLNNLLVALNGKYAEISTASKKFGIKMAQQVCKF